MIVEGTSFKAKARGISCGSTRNNAGKTALWCGKITIFNGKITIFNGKITIFNGKITIFNGSTMGFWVTLWLFNIAMENHLCLMGKAIYKWAIFYGYVSSPEGNYGIWFFLANNSGFVQIFCLQIKPISIDAEKSGHVAYETIRFWVVWSLEPYSSIFPSIEWANVAAPERGLVSMV